MTGRTVDLRGNVPDGSPIVTVIMTEKRLAHITSLVEQEVQRVLERCDVQPYDWKPGERP